MVLQSDSSAASGLKYLTKIAESQYLIKSSKHSLRKQKCCLFVHVCTTDAYRHTVTLNYIRLQAHAHINTVTVLMKVLTSWHQSVDRWISVCHEREGNIPTVPDPFVACLFKSSVWQYMQFAVMLFLINASFFALSMRHRANWFPVFLHCLVRVARHPLILRSQDISHLCRSRPRPLTDRVLPVVFNLRCNCSRWNLGSSYFGLAALVRPWENPADTADHATAGLTGAGLGVPVVFKSERRPSCALCLFSTDKFLARFLLPSLAACDGTIKDVNWRPEIAARFCADKVSAAEQGKCPSSRVSGPKKRETLWEVPTCDAIQSLSNHIQSIHCSQQDSSGARIRYDGHFFLPMVQLVWVWWVRWLQIDRPRLIKEKSGHASQTLNALSWFEIFGKKHKTTGKWKTTEFQ